MRSIIEYNIAGFGGGLIVSMAFLFLWISKLGEKERKRKRKNREYQKWIRELRNEAWMRKVKKRKHVKP